MYEKYNENQVFIGIPFDESMENILEVIQEACKENRLDPKVVNQGIGANSIIDEIKNLIEESEFLIIDLSLENPNVYYELGYADGVGNEGSDILILAKEGTNLKFNIQHRRVHFYKDAYDLSKRLKTILPKFITESRNRLHQ